MRFRDLRGFPKLFVDFAERAPKAAGFFLRLPEKENLRAQAGPAWDDKIFPRGALCDLLIEQAGRFGCLGPTLGNIEKLRSANAGVVVARVRPGLFGGSLATWLALLTAARLASWLTHVGSPAVPLCWIDAHAEPADLAAGMISRQGPVRLALTASPSSRRETSEAIRALLRDAAKIAEMDIGDSEVLQTLEAAADPECDFAEAWGRATARLLGPFGIMIVDSGAPAIREAMEAALDRFDRAQLDLLLDECARRLRSSGYPAGGADELQPGAGSGRALPQEFFQHRLLPVAAIVISEDQAGDFVLAQSLRAGLGMRPALAWPRMSVTLLDARCRKTMTKHGLSLGETFTDPASLTERLAQRLGFEETLSRIGKLEEELGGRLAELQSLVPAEEKLAGRVKDSCARMAYQAGRLRYHVARAGELRRAAISRQVGRLCGIVAPWGKRQETEIAAFQFLLRHSISIPQILYDRADPFAFEHQIIMVE